MQYMETSVSNPFPMGGTWCKICKTHGHDPYHYPMMQKYKTVPKSSYCKFCKSVGHYDKHCRMMDLMKEKTSYNYRVQEEMMTRQDAPQFNQVPLPYNNAQQQYNIMHHNIIMCNHSITPRSINRYLSTMHHEEIEVDI
jgi:hypothetical protein